MARRDSEPGLAHLKHHGQELDSAKIDIYYLSPNNLHPNPDDDVNASRKQVAPHKAVARSRSQPKCAAVSHMRSFFERP